MREDLKPFTIQTPHARVITLFYMPDVGLKSVRAVRNGPAMGSEAVAMVLVIPGSQEVDGRHQEIWALSTVLSSSVKCY